MEAKQEVSAEVVPPPPRLQADDIGTAFRFCVCIYCVFSQLSSGEPERPARGRSFTEADYVLSIFRVLVMDGGKGPTTQLLSWLGFQWWDKENGTCVFATHFTCVCLCHSPHAQKPE